MPTSCCAIGCRNRQRKGAGVKFFRFPGPDKADKRRKWVRALRRGIYGDSTRQWEPKGHERVCSEHFLSGNTSDDPLDPDYVPSVFSFSSTSSVNFSTKARYTRAKKRKSVHVDPNPQLPQHDQGNSIPTEPFKENELITDDNMTTNNNLHAINQELAQENARLHEDIAFLRSSLDASKKQSKFLKKFQVNAETLSDFQCKFYTGIPKVGLFVFIVGLVSPFLSQLRSISKADQVLLTMMKLRLGLKNLDLGYRFGISSSTVSKVINICIPAMAARLRFLIHWPSREEVFKNQPQKFKKYKNCRVIIDCSEIFTERPYNLKARAKTWSNYKHHHTMKFLVGITPYGTVSFLSRCWGGRISDVEVTRRSGFYDKIEYGDMVMADRGFTISEELAVRGATLVIPPFIAGRKQLPGKVVQNARQISSLRIHVERAIERIKNFKILKEIIPLSLSPLTSDIVEICSAITNLMPRLIK